MGTKKLVKPGSPAQPAQQQLDLGDRLMLFERWLVNNWKKVAVATAAIVVIILAWGIVVSLNNAAEDKAEAAFSQAKDVAEIEALLVQYGDAECANYYRLQIAADALAGENFDKALEMHLAVAENTDSTALCCDSMLAAAGIMEKQGKNQESLNMYAEIAGNSDFVPGRRVEAYYQAGRIALLLQDINTALACLDAAVAMSESTVSVYSDMANHLLSTVPAQ